MIQRQLTLTDRDNDRIEVLTSDDPDDTAVLLLRLQTAEPGSTLRSFWLSDQACIELTRFVDQEQDRYRGRRTTSTVVEASIQCGTIGTVQGQRCECYLHDGHVGKHVSADGIAWDEVPF